METDERATACHWMLLRLAGWIPDGLLTQSREWLAQGRLHDVAKAVTHAVLTARIRISPDDLDLLAELHADVGSVPSVLQTVETTEIEPIPAFGFATDHPDTAEGGSSADPAGSAEKVTRAEAVAQEAVAAASDAPSVLAVWRTWRFPADRAPWPPPRQIFVVETEEDASLVAVTSELQTALVAAGEAEPQIEVYPTRTDPPVYQQLARGVGALLWARNPDPGIRLAAVFDEVDAESGPRLRPDHPTVDEQERDLLLGYLSRGTLLMESTSGMEDIWDREAGPVVPISFRTDGHWIWSDATTYYLYEYSLAPEPAFLEHIRAREYTFEAVDGAAIHRALAVLEQPLDSEPVWQMG